MKSILKKDKRTLAILLILVLLIFLISIFYISLKNEKMSIQNYSIQDQEERVLLVIEEPISNKNIDLLKEKIEVQNPEKEVEVFVPAPYSEDEDVRQMYLNRNQK